MQVKLLLFISVLAAQILLPITGGIGGPSGVTFDSGCSSVNTNTSLSCNLTIGSSVTNGAVIVGVTTAGVVTGMACTVGGTTAPLISGTVWPTTVSSGTFGLATGSTTGSTAVACSWTGNTSAGIGAISVSGANQVTPFLNGNSAAAGSGNPTLSITSASGHLTFSVAGNMVSPSAPSQTQFFLTLVPFGSSYMGGMYGAGAATVTHSWVITSGIWVMTGADIQP